jgi:hypothetical protein
MLIVLSLKPIGWMNIKLKKSYALFHMIKCNFMVNIQVYFENILGSNLI